MATVVIEDENRFDLLPPPVPPTHREEPLTVLLPY